MCLCATVDCADSRYILRDPHFLQRRIMHHLTTLVYLISYSPSKGCLEDIAVSDKTAVVPIELV